MSSAASLRIDVEADDRVAGYETNPEFQLLVACTSPSRTQYVVGPVNWNSVLQLAQHHGVISQLSDTLEYSVAQIPSTVIEKVRNENRNNTRQALWLTREMFRILGQLTARNIDAMPYKGPVLAEMLYGNVAARQFNDIDILIRARDVPVAIAALHELGYEPGVELTPRQERAYLRSGYEYTFDGERGRNLVELQWNVLPRFYSVDLKTEDLFERAQTQTVSGQKIRSLSLEDLLIVLCLHAAKHGWVQLSWLSDVATLAGSETIDWDTVGKRSAALGVGRILDLTFALCHRLWRTPLPCVLPLECEPILRHQLELLAQGEEYNTDSLPYFRRMLQARERRSDRARFLWRLATTPSLGEWSAIRLPSPLFPLYGAVRAVRLAKRMVTTR